MTFSAKEEVSVDVVVPVYDDHSGVLSLLDALERQSLPPRFFRVFVVDNASPLPLCSLPKTSFSSYLLHCSKSGSYAARNASLPLLSADWIALTDADCLPHVHWLRNGLRAIEGLDNKESTPILAGAVQIVPVSPQSPTSADLVEMYFGMPQERYVRSGRFGITANLWVKKTILLDLNGFDSDLKSGGDRDFCLRAFRQGVDVKYIRDMRVFHPARDLCALRNKARRLIGGRFDAAGSSLLKKLWAICIHTKPLLRECFQAIILPLPWQDRFKVLFLLIQLRWVAILEWFHLLKYPTASVR